MKFCGYLSGYCGCEGRCPIAARLPPGARFLLPMRSMAIRCKHFAPRRVPEPRKRRSRKRPLHRWYADQERLI